MRRLIAAIITVVLLAGLLWAGRERGNAPPVAAESPAEQAAAPLTLSTPVVAAPPVHPAEARLQTLLEGARQADVGAYLDSFTGPIRARLDREVSERGRDRFAADLAAASRSRKSHAIFAAEPEGADAARVVVEAVYPDRNERQTYRLERRDDAWRVVAVETIRSRQPRIKFGSVASFDAPEGVPVQGTGLRVETGEEGQPPVTPR